MAWCKARALEYIDRGDLNGAFVSMASDLSKHPDTSGHIAIALGLKMVMGGHLRTEKQMREFIEGFH